MTEKYLDFIGLTSDEMDEIINSNIHITDPRLTDAVYGVVLDVVTALAEKNAHLIAPSQARSEPCVV